MCRTTFPISVKSYSWILFKHQTSSRSSSNLLQNKRLAFHASLLLRSFCLFCRLWSKRETTLSPRQALNRSYIHRELPNLLFDKYIPGPHVPFSVHISTWRINTLHCHRFVIIDSVDKRFKLNERSLDNRNSGNEKHERYDFPCLSLPSWTPDTMRGSSDRHLSSFYLQPSTLSTYHGFKVDE